MSYSLDVNNEYNLVKSKLLRLSLLFALVLTLVLVGDVLLVALSGEEYIAQLIISIVITILFSWFAIYFFTNIYSDINNRYRYFRGYEAGLKPTEEVEYLRQSDELCYINGVYVYPLYVRYSQGLTKVDKVIFTFAKKLNFKEGDKLTITTYQRILIEAESHK